MVKYNKIINKGENEMLSAILIFLFVFCGSIMIHEKVAKKNNEKKTNIATTIVALVLVLGMFVLNVAVIGQGISEINEAFNNAGNTVFYGQATAEEAAAAFRADVQEILARNN